MDNQEQIIQQLTQAGYEPVYVWDAQPNEADPDHTHDFETHLHILAGEIKIEMDGQATTLTQGMQIDIPKDKVHSGLAGASGCKYIVAEKH